MARNILLTSLSITESNPPVRYFSNRNKSGTNYCDAILDAEANIKAVLSGHSIDEIIIIGRAGSYDEKDELNLVSLRHGNSLDSADKAALSAYALLQYRLAKFTDDLPSVPTEEDEGLPADMREKMIRFIWDFQEKTPELKAEEFNRMFDLLNQSSQTCEKFWSALFDAFPELCNIPDLCRQWVKDYLYAELDPSVKMKCLPENDGVSIRFIPETIMEDGGQWVDSMMAMKNTIIEDQEDINLYISLNSDDAAETFVVLNLLNILVTLPGSGVKLKKIFTIRNVSRHMTGIIRDDTNGFDITEMFHGIRSFLNYGKADMIMDIWKKTEGDDVHIAGMVYAMRDVDVGLSMCNMPVVERGILRLRKLFKSEEFWRASGYYGMLFCVIAESIREDYGTLLEGDGRIPFIDLVKWAYRHQFYQQTLTLIESNAPEDLVRNGIFYYCGDEKQKEHVTNLFAQKRMELRPQEFYKIDNIDHYFIKTYDRTGTKGRGEKGEDPQHVYAVLRAQSVENKDPSQITGLTACSSTETLQNLLFAYYHIGFVRNKIAHADAAAMTDKRLKVSGSDDIPSLVWMKDAIDSFINSYEKALAEVRDKKPEVITITGESVRKAANRIRKNNSPQNRRH